MIKQFSIKAKRIQVVSHASQKYATRCRGCGKTVDLVTFAEAGEIIGVTVDAVINQAAKGALHIAVRPESMLVCLNSLLAVDFDSSSKSFVYSAGERLATKTVAKRVLK